MNSHATAFVKHYRRINSYAGVESADPHTLVSMLYNGLSEAMSNAKGAMDRGDFAGKGRAVVKAIDILESLRTSLDVDRGGDVAGNLERLYAYMEERLTHANLMNEGSAIDELMTLNDTLRGAWAAIGPDVRQASA